MFLVSEDLMVLKRAEERAADDTIRYKMPYDAQLESFSLLSLAGMFGVTSSIFESSGVLHRQPFNPIPFTKFIRLFKSS